MSASQALFFLSLSFPCSCFLERMWLFITVLLRLSSSRQPSQKSLALETLKGSLPYSLTLSAGLMLFGSLLEELLRAVVDLLTYEEPVAAGLPSSSFFERDLTTVAASIYPTGKQQENKTWQALYYKNRHHYHYHYCSH